MATSESVVSKPVPKLSQELQLYSGFDMDNVTTARPREDIWFRASNPVKSVSRIRDTAAVQLAGLLHA